MYEKVYKVYIYMYEKVYKIGLFVVMSANEIYANVC